MIDTAQCEMCLRRGLALMEIELQDAQIGRLLMYLQELHKWNRAYNLSAVRDPLAMVGRHLLDSLALVPYLREYSRGQALRLLDVGSGGGLPGIPLAIACPYAKVTLLDSNGKKTRFLFQALLKLGLHQTGVENHRLQHFSPAHKFAIVISRAFFQPEQYGCRRGATAR